MKSIKTQDAVGHALLHDIVRIVIGEVKDTPFRRGHVITEEDIPKLLDLGKEHGLVYDGFMLCPSRCPQRIALHAPVLHASCRLWRKAKCGCRWPFQGRCRPITCYQ